MSASGGLVGGRSPLCARRPAASAGPTSAKGRKFSRKEAQGNQGDAGVASSAYIEKGMFAEAVIEAKKAGELSTAQTASIVFEGHALARMGRKDETRILLDKLLKLSKETSVPATHIALLYNALGENDEAFKWLDRGIEQRDPKMAFLKVQPRWNNLRGDPRFQEIMKRVGF